MLCNTWHLKPETWKGHRSVVCALLLATFAGGCTSANMPRLPLLPPASDAGGAPAQTGPHETFATASGTPTGVFAQVARGALGCWFAANGPLKASHVYRAEAEPPAKGGDAEIVIFERDVSLRDQRGTRAYRISFAGEGGGVRVTATALKFELKVAEAMARDVETWAKAGSGCHLPAVLPPPAPPPSPKTAKTAKAAKGPAQSKKR
jgi:hypothetical protein